MSGTLQKDNDGQHLETWGEFGTNLELYIKKNKKKLIIESYDLILGFSRGGTILAYSFACLLKDIINEYSDNNKACVRQIPKELICKRNDPCFVMDHPASDHEKNDIKNLLENELKIFAKNHNNNKPINVLIMDDNLTGATRVRFLEYELSKMNCVESFKTLAYVRHSSFLPMSTIKEFPKDKDYFVMPWHIPHSKKELDLQSEEIYGYNMKISILVNNGFSLEAFIDTIKNGYIIRKKTIVNGTSNFHFREIKKNTGDFVELKTQINRYYPPKPCLKSNDSDNNGKKIEEFSEYLPLCSLCIAKTMVACLTCSYLNCNKRLLKNALNAANSQTISFEIENYPELKLATKKWFVKSISNIKIM